jgi:hypothetical protein
VYAARVTISLHDGRSFQSGIVEGNISFPQQGWDEERLEDKFRWLARRVLDHTDVETLIDLVWRFDRVTDVGELTRRLA